ncbi:hypothetical protein BKA63DRAFT_191188 [Paraphoma chrysanthemicola]|nr:hypothetical protein BKA63DRAFT_191188 [Paraphoma chrysanthemicola]
MMYVTMIEGRYIQFGNYSGLDMMMAKVLKHVREYHAKQLTSPLYAYWITEALKMHFFKKPNYAGNVYAPEDVNAMTISEEEEVQLMDEMVKDVSKYVEELHERRREMTMKTSFTKTQATLYSFNAADAESSAGCSSRRRSRLGRRWWQR